MLSLLAYWQLAYCSRYKLLLLLALLLALIARVIARAKINARLIARVKSLLALGLLLACGPVGGLVATPLNARAGPPPGAGKRPFPALKPAKPPENALIPRRNSLFGTKNRENARPYRPAGHFVVPPARPGVKRRRRRMAVVPRMHGARRAAVCQKLANRRAPPVSPPAPAGGNRRRRFG